MTYWRSLVCLATLGLLGFGIHLGSIPWAAPSARASPARDPAAGHHMVAAPGLVEPNGEEREIGSQVIGIIREMQVEENDRIVAGQIIAVVDNNEQLARLESARSQLALRNAELDRVIHGARPEERREAHAAVAETEANLDLARREYERKVPLAQSGASTQAALDQATSALNAIAAHRTVMSERLAVMEAGSRVEDIEAARAQVALAEADVALAEALLDKTIIRSPITGSVLRRYRAAGEAVGNMPPTPVVVVGDLSRLRVRAEVDETDVGRVTIGQRVEVTADAYPDRRFGGTVYRVSSRLGGKAVQTGRPADRVDTKVLQVLIDLEPGTALPIGLRVDAYFVGEAAMDSSPRGVTN
jgi:HlyD family secretion protein